MCVIVTLKTKTGCSADDRAARGFVPGYESRKTTEIYRIAPVKLE